jgi:hypothetical protein
MMLSLERDVTFWNTKIYSMQHEQNAYVSVVRSTAQTGPVSAIRRNDTVPRAR